MLAAMHAAARSVRSGVMMAALAAAGQGLVAGPSPDWTPVRWNGESALGAESSGWRAVVSLERGRLVHFGPAGSEENLLFAPSERGERQGWGGHIVWLGPQAEWPAIWPPLPAWERSAAAAHAQGDGRLELTMPAGDGGWAQLVRSYQWRGDTLECRVALRGGSKAAQLIQIVQVPASAQVRVAKAEPMARLPEGFAVLKVGALDQVVPAFPWPPQAARRSDGSLLWQPTGEVIKVAFTPQPLVATVGDYELVVERVADEGPVAGAVDDGLYAQLYLGRADTPFIELEQLSPRFAAGAEASATIALRARRLP